MDTYADKEGGKRKKEIKKNYTGTVDKWDIETRKRPENNIKEISKWIARACIQHDYDYFKIDHVKRIGLMIFFLFYISSNFILFIKLNGDISSTSLVRNNKI